MYKDIFTCVEGSLPIKYQGVPVHNTKLGNVDWKRIEEKLEGKSGKLMSNGVMVVS